MTKNGLMTLQKRELGFEPIAGAINDFLADQFVRKSGLSFN